ncbi:MAG: hypothetical protein HOH77_12550, partial [Candidatus Latescibacteria bacterium]|nr:hypothetical protein [Candidatus Latescibacterota bacterium]
TTLVRGRVEGDDARGLYHDGVGYYFLGEQNFVVQAETQTGSWKDLEANSTRPETITKDVFKMWVDHGAQPVDGAYAYAVMPGIDRDAFATQADDLPFKVLAQTSAVQAVEFADRNLAQVVFFEAGNLKVLDTMDVSVNAPCLVMVQTDGQCVSLSVADPTQKLDQIQITIGGVFEGTGAVVEGSLTVVTVDLPQNEWAGKTVDVSLLKQ